MYYEEEAPKKSRRRRKKHGLLYHLVKFLLRLAVIVVVLAAILYAIPVGLFMIEPKESLSPASDLGSGVLNVLLLGADWEEGVDTSKDDVYTRTDTIIVASISYTGFKLTSILRDTIVDIPGHGSQRVNTAYRYGGPELVMRTLNENFGMNITKYAVVDFATLADVVNAAGGVDLKISSKEQYYLNYNLKDSWKKVFGPRGDDPKDTAYVDLDFSKADEGGYVQTHLDGYQALAYARIRKMDSDFNRSARQRALIGATVSRIRSHCWNPVMLYRLVKIGLTGIKTNLNALEIASIATKAAVCGMPEELRLPVSGSFSDNGSTLSGVNFSRNREAFRQFVYGN